jgi:hypothetical protein
LPLAAGQRYVIFSDHHKGAGTGADDFKGCKATYLAALDHYFAEGYQLIILGDAEELWEEPFEDVVRTYRDVFQSEARFHNQGRYLRIFGNHDNNWASRGQVEKHLHPFFPALAIREGMILRYDGPDADSSGELFLVHGHQGTLDSELFAPISRKLVRAFWRTFQILFGYAGTQPAKDPCLRGEHDTLMYQWASTQGKLLLIAGHTHRSIWSSRTLLEQRLMAREALQLANDIAPIADYGARLAEIEAAIHQLQAEESTLCDDTIKTRWCYFNDGCCSYSSGAVTGYELEDGRLRLVSWDGSSQQRSVLGEGRLADIFRYLSPARAGASP